MTTVDSLIPQDSEQPAKEARPALEPPREKFRIRFRKDGPLRFISHHDLLRCWERLLRRAELPLRFSQGFHPKPRLSFPLALSLGAIGAQEILEIELTIPMSAENLHRLLTDHAVPGLTVVEVSLLPNSQRTSVVAVEYSIPAPATLTDAEARTRAEQLLGQAEILVRREHPDKPAKTMDIRPFLEAVQWSDGTFRVRCLVEEGRTPRIEEILSALGGQDWIKQGTVVTRSQIVLSETVATSPTTQAKVKS